MSATRIYKRRLLTSYLSVVSSNALILFVLSVLGFVLLNSQSIANYFKEQVTMTVFLDDQAKEMEREQLTTTMRLALFTKSVRFISKETAAAEHSATIGEDFMDFLGYNPLQDALDIGLKAEFVTTEVLDSLSDVMEQKPFVSEVLYDRPLIVLLNQNIERIRFWLFICTTVFVAIALLLINHSIKLSIYSKRLVIQTMLLVGARKGFIRRPFLWRYVLLGIISAVLALTGFAGLLSFLVRLVPQVDWWGSIENIAFLAGGIMLCSVLISTVSSFFATQRHLKLTYDILY
ncbi:MAG: cell division protein FtsX [Flavobacteriaceae bacterium]|jgi:cell division transport system permease protein|nr:cell division protein FtsX [Flavobacteriaceae bacterium]|tara:strand:+ start:10379 stop:11248 length:870 start_codon:yes stop_codon:yes gene_type:complete